MSIMGWGYAQNIQILFWAEDIAQKPSLLDVFGYNNCSVSNANDFNPLMDCNAKRRQHVYLIDGLRRRLAL